MTIYRQELLNGIQQVRERHGNLKGLKLQDILAQVEAVVKPMVAHKSLLKSPTRTPVKVHGGATMTLAAVLSQLRLL